MSVLIAVLILAGLVGNSQARPAYSQGVKLSLAGKKIGVIVIGTDHNWDRQAFQGVLDKIKELGGESIAVNAERDDQKHVAGLENLLTQKPDAIINILGNAKLVEPEFVKIREAKIPLFTVDTPSPSSINNVQSDNYVIGSVLARTLAEDIDGEGNIAVFNGFYGIRVVGIRYDQLRQVLKDYPKINIIQPELKDVIPNTIEDARKNIQDLLVKYPKGQLKAVWSGWDIPSIGVVQALEDAGRTEVKVYGVDGDPTAIELLADPKSPFAADAAQKPYLIGQTSAENVARYLAGQPVTLNTYIEPYLVTKANVEDAKVALGLTKK